MSYNKMMIGAKAFRHFMILSFCQIIEIMPNMVLKTKSLTQCHFIGLGTIHLGPNAMKRYTTLIYEFM
jgi:hypothetical protein